MTKIIALQDLADKVMLRKKNGHKIVLCHGVFDLLHIGHIRYLEAAKAMGDVLVVTLTPDQFVDKGPGRPAFNEKLRAEAIAGLQSVDFVAINQWPTAINTIKLLQPDLYVKGSNVQPNHQVTDERLAAEIRTIQEQNGDIRFVQGVSFSSSDLLVKHSDIYSPAQKAYLQRLRSKYSMQDVYTYLEKMQECRVLVLGETIIDKYVYCDAIGKSGKEPMLVTRRLRDETYLGGILAIAKHLTEFCSSITIHTYLGEQNEYYDFIGQHLHDNMDLKVINKIDSPTIVKCRHIEEYSKTKLLGVYDINDADLNPQQEAAFCAELEKTLQDYDLVIIADYGHGLITPKAVDIISQHAPSLAVNTQVNAANIGFHTISKYPRADYVCIHEGELRHDYRSRTRSAEDLIRSLYRKMGCKDMLITKGKKGALGYNDQDGFLLCPAFAGKIVDRVGAGDTVLAITALCVAANMPLDLTLLFGNLAGAQAVATMGNKTPLNKDLLIKSVNALL